MKCTLIVFAGLPGTGKSTIARALASEIGALWLRIDSLEQAIRGSGIVPGSIGTAGYLAAYALASDNLRLGLSVVADAVNDCMLARDAWRDKGHAAGARVLEVEIVCSDVAEHRRRVETRAAEVPGLVLPDWTATIGRAYEPWTRAPLVVDTAERTVAACVAGVRAWVCRTDVHV